MRFAAIAFALLLAAVSAAAANDASGVVLDTAGKPVAGAHVYVYTATPKVGISFLCPYCYRDCGKREAADAQGAFRVKDLDSTLLFDLLAVADGYEPMFARKTDPAAGPVTLTLTPRSAADTGRLIVGTVVDRDGKPVVGAIVEPNGYHMERGIAYGNFPGVDNLSITDGKGAFALRIPSAGGKLDVRVTARAFAPKIERTLAPAEPRTIRMAEGPGVTGHVTRGGKPVAGARVAIVQYDRRSMNYLGKFEIGTNEYGLFAMPNVGPNEIYVVYAPMEGLAAGVTEPKLVAVGGGTATVDAGTLEVVPGRRIAGKVTVPAGRTIPPHTRILFWSQTSQDARNVELAADGTFVFEPVPHDQAGIALRFPGLHISQRSTHVDERGGIFLPAGGDVSDVQIVFDCDG